jgi:hypothetical protein
MIPIPNIDMGVEDEYANLIAGSMLQILGLLT